MTEAVVTTEGVAAPVETPTPPPEVQAPPEPAKNPPEQPEGSEPKGVAKRIKELTDARRAAEQREERLLRLLEQRQETPPPSQQQLEQQHAPKSLKDFGYDEKAYTDHLYTEARKVAEASAKEAGLKFRAEQEAIQRRAKFDERVSQFAATVDDYSEVVTDSTPVSEGMADAIMDSEEAGALMYYLGNNPDEARKLFHMSAAKAGREIQKIEDRLVAERKKAAEKPVSQAPPPPPKIEGASPGNIGMKSTDPDAEKLSGDEWLKLREKEVRAARKK